MPVVTVDGRSDLGLDNRAWTIGLHRFDTGVATGDGLVHLTCADDLVVPGLEIEIRTAIGGILAVVSLFQGAVVLNGNYPFHRRVPAFVVLAAQNNLTISGFENKYVLPFVVRLQFIPSSHCVPLGLK